MSAKVRYIRPETICIGDIIKVSWNHKDVIKSIQGEVAHREHYTHSTEYSTAEGQVLCTHWRYQKPDFRVTLILRKSDTNPALFNMENI